MSRVGADPRLARLLWSVQRQLLGHPLDSARLQLGLFHQVFVGEALYGLMLLPVAYL
ncbi:hypothetical protein [Acetobacter pasteurianus]|uniref:hypothetical protein n=1 Tax=Acetobacter pasteurianus TaxID=438 RepID=UPI0003121E4A|nr:hypothetical protein [Acetobacter pasteurianus]